MTNKFNISDRVCIVFITETLVCEIIHIYTKDNTIWYRVKKDNFEYDTNEEELLKYNEVKNNGTSN
ncbi:MAG: hypothetical protein IJ880_05330 [Bacilli bacterium]|nr:hypothetical protein [Bacilli bacterium]